MRKPVLIATTLTAAALAAAVGSAVWARRDAGVAPAPAPAFASSAAAPAQAQPLLATPQARRYRERQQFQREARQFFDQAARLPAVERERRAQALQQGIDAYERAGELSAGETVLLRVALIRATVADPVRQAELVESLAVRYRGEAERRNAQWAQQQAQDPRFRQYKQREREIVAEVMAMEAIPNGLSRNEYLRQRLQAERERAYR
ncbi:hypothetical protein K4L06_14485 [Lysobacter sp. BMK333-48F3]|uniref:hypothetical protein n=1 Tax=Lysobacter sp. BMK333-48F3 TaxID=2867962 RepID=UPI001C8C2B33|nr:hypothetical protein [Lysobacter sp. BMK333-48F3]MBX9402517.1 hypothetical protein [Lysobacter sp. BMK333-48F3]